jgi:cholesterol oxidase
MSEHFQVVVVGSGFGGSVMSYRLAEAGVRVCLLERGQPYPPNSFPRSPYRMKRNFWDPSDGLYGMFDVWSFRGLAGLVSSGLGGGSLIYANVLIRKDEKWFVQEDLRAGGYELWPVSRADLDPHYARVEKMMNVQQYPIGQSPYDSTPKVLAFRAAAEQLKLPWQLLNLAVTFHNPEAPAVPGEPIKEVHPNYHGRTRYTCRLCGECYIGCNYGSKNTLDYNYLTEAARCGAVIRTLCEVRRLEPREGATGYSLEYVQHDLARADKKTDTSRLPQTTITCDQLILSAGAFGTPYLLLKNRSAFPRISQKLGTRFSANGDYLAFMVRSRTQDGSPRLLEPSYGPVITSAIRMDDALDSGGPPDPARRGFYIEDGGYPDFANWLIEAAQAPGLIYRVLRFGQRYLRGLFGWNEDTDLSEEISQLIGPTKVSMSSVPLLSMGRDIPNGNVFLRDRYLDVDWKPEASAAYYDRLRRTVRSVADALQAEYRDNPSWYLGQILTAHPLGGCPMGRDQSEGVVNRDGEVFNYPGLFIADGSVMPGPVGPNPSLTIAALADRFADRVIQNAKGG